MKSLSSLFFDDQSRLPTVRILQGPTRTVQPRSRQYETLSGGDNLMFALLKLHRVKDGDCGSGG